MLPAGFGAVSALFAPAQRGRALVCGWGAFRFWGEGGSRGTLGLSVVWLRGFSVRGAALVQSVRVSQLGVCSCLAPGPPARPAGGASGERLSPGRFAEALPPSLQLVLCGLSCLLPSVASVGAVPGSLRLGGAAFLGCLPAVWLVVVGLGGLVGGVGFCLSFSLCRESVCFVCFVRP